MKRWRTREEAGADRETWRSEILKKPKGCAWVMVSIAAIVASPSSLAWRRTKWAPSYSCRLKKNTKNKIKFWAVGLVSQGLITDRLSEYWWVFSPEFVRFSWNLNVGEVVDLVSEAYLSGGAELILTVLRPPVGGKFKVRVRVRVYFCLVPSFGSATAIFLWLIFLSGFYFIFVMDTSIFKNRCQ